MQAKECHFHLKSSHKVFTMNFPANIYEKWCLLKRGVSPLLRHIRLKKMEKNKEEKEIYLSQWKRYLQIFLQWKMDLVFKNPFFPYEDDYRKIIKLKLI